MQGRGRGLHFSAATFEPLRVPHSSNPGTHPALPESLGCENLPLGLFVSQQIWQMHEALPTVRPSSFLYRRRTPALAQRIYSFYRLGAVSPEAQVIRYGLVAPRSRGPVSNTPALLQGGSPPHTRVPSQELPQLVHQGVLLAPHNNSSSCDVPVRHPAAPPVWLPTGL